MRDPMRKLAVLAGFLGLAALPVSAQDAPVAAQAEQRPYLTRASAGAGAEACLALARSEGWRVAVAVTDRGGELVHFTRMDDVYTRQQSFARLKAESAATTPVSTAQLADAVFAEGSPLRGIELIGGLTTVEGGVTTRTRGGYHIGGVGVSGASPAQDGRCARAAADAIAEALG